MKNQVTSIEQSRRLLELGVPAEKASMCWIKNPTENEYDICVHDEFCYEVASLEAVPAFTVADLLEMMPERIPLQNEDEGDFVIGKVDGEWAVDYDAFCDSDNSILNISFKAVEWLVLNEYKLKI